MGLSKIGTRVLVSVYTPSMSDPEDSLEPWAWKAPLDEDIKLWPGAEWSNDPWKMYLVEGDIVLWQWVDGKWKKVQVPWRRKLFLYDPEANRFRFKYWKRICVPERWLGL